MKRLFIFAFVMSFALAPLATHAGFFDIFRIGNNLQSAQVRTSVTTTTQTASYKKGDKADVILQVQQALNAKGLYNGDISGLIGSKTEASITAWQKSARLPVTGELDTATINSILGRGGSTGDLRGGGITPTPGTLLCNTNTAPFIKVISPNGGETYNPGQDIKVKWQSCNIPASTLLEINVSGSGIAFGFLAPSGTPNDGAEVITQSWPVGTYQIIIGTPLTPGGFDNSALAISDQSDNFFSIVDGLGGGGTNGICNMEVLYPYEGAQFNPGVTITSLIRLHNDVPPGSCGWVVFEGVAGGVEVEGQSISGWFNDPINYDWGGDLVNPNHDVYFATDMVLPSTITPGIYTLVFTEEGSGGPPYDTFEMSIEVLP